MDKAGAKAERGYPGPTRGPFSCYSTDRQTDVIECIIDAGGYARVGIKQHKSFTELHK